MSGDVKKKPLGKLLKEKGLIGEEHIQFAIQEQKVTKEKLGEVLVRLCCVTEYDVATAMAEQEGVPYVDVDEVLPPQDLLMRFNKKLCLKHAFLPLGTDGGLIHVASADIAGNELAQVVTRHSGLKPTFYLSERTKTINALNKLYYFCEHPVEKLIETEVKLLSQDGEMARGTDSLVRYIMELAIKMRATDIHIRPMDKATNIAFRIDGVMTSVLSLPPSFDRIVSTIKAKADMDIAEQRLPQDGGLSTSILNSDYDLRVSTIVLSHGENMVLRVLPRESPLMGMRQLGFFEKDIKKVHQMFNEPFGIVLLTGPTGSGKSTTLYGGIRTLNLLQRNVVTVEDPVEYRIPLLRQTQVNEKAGYTFAGAIRHFLRHDPDVIMVGEIRDSETAATAISASATGHLVLSTLHTNDVFGAIPRLVDLGVKPFLIADSLIGVASQRLVRKICSNCKEPHKLEAREKAYLADPSVEELSRGKGCELCNGTGYFGRTLVYELLTIDEELSRLISLQAEPVKIVEKAKENGFKDMRSVAIEKVKEGITTIEEVARVLGQIKRETDSSSDETPVAYGTVRAL